MRIAGAWDAFECAVRAVLRQESSVDESRALAARLVLLSGRPIAGGVDGLTHLFPSAAEIQTADLAAVGITGRCGTALRALAGAVADGTLDFDAPAEVVTARLVALPGFEARSAARVALRGLGEPDAFPAADLPGLEERAEAWRPWRGYALAHLVASDARR